MWEIHLPKVQFLLLHLRISDGLSTQVTGKAQEAIPQCSRSEGMPRIKWFLWFLPSQLDISPKLCSNKKKKLGSAILWCSTSCCLFHTSKKYAKDRCRLIFQHHYRSPLVIFCRDFGFNPVGFPLQVAHSWWFLHQRDECKVCPEDWSAPDTSEVKNMGKFQHYESVEAGAEVETSKYSRVPSSACFLWLSLSDRFCITALLHPICSHSSPGAWATSHRCRRRQCTSNGELPSTRALDKKTHSPKTWQNQAFFERSHVDEKNVLKQRYLAAQQFFRRSVEAFHPMSYHTSVSTTKLKNDWISPFHSFSASQNLFTSTSHNWLLPPAIFSKGQVTGTIPLQALW